MIKANTKEADAEQTEVLVRELGVYGLKSIGGCLTLGAGNYDSLTKTFIHAPRPVQGLLKVFSLPPISLRPESWVPATVASYQTVSFDLDNAFTALNEIANKFQPGMVNLVEQQLVGPNGGAAAQLPERCLRPNRRPHHRDQRLQEADQGRQPTHARRCQPRRHQGIPEHAIQAARARRRRPSEARVPGDDDL